MRRRLGYSWHLPPDCKELLLREVYRERITYSTAKLGLAGLDESDYGGVKREGLLGGIARASRTIGTRPLQPRIAWLPNRCGRSRDP